MEQGMIQIDNADMLKRTALKHASFLPVVFVTDTSPRSTEALEIFEKLHREKKAPAVAVVNVSKVKDIHGAYDIHAAPTVITMKSGELVRKLEGLQTEETYRLLLSDAPRKTADGKELPPLRVTVYTTRSCPHCTTVKNHLRLKGIPYREVDLGSDPSAATELSRRTGQTGVPQTEINGAFVLGADLPKINRLVGIG